MRRPPAATARTRLPRPAARARGSLEGLAVVDDGHHVLHIAVRVLPVPQMLVPVQLRLLLVPAEPGGQHGPARPAPRPADRSTPGTSVGAQTERLRGWGRLMPTGAHQLKQIIPNFGHQALKYGSIF